MFVFSGLIQFFFSASVCVDYDERLLKDGTHIMKIRLTNQSFLDMGECEGVSQIYVAMDHGQTQEKICFNTEMGIVSVTQTSWYVTTNATGSSQQQPSIRTKIITIKFQVPSKNLKNLVGLFKIKCQFLGQVVDIVSDKCYAFFPRKRTQAISKLLIHSALDVGCCGSKNHDTPQALIGKYLKMSTNETAKLCTYLAHQGFSKQEKANTLERFINGLFGRKSKILWDGGYVHLALSYEQILSMLTDSMKGTEHRRFLINFDLEKQPNLFVYYLPTACDFDTEIACFKIKDKKSDDFWKSFSSKYVKRFFHSLDASEHDSDGINSRNQIKFVKNVSALLAKKMATKINSDDLDFPGLKTRKRNIKIATEIDFSDLVDESSPDIQTDGSTIKWHTVTTLSAKGALALPTSYGTGALALPVKKKCKLSQLKTPAHLLRSEMGICEKPKRLELIDDELVAVKEEPDGLIEDVVEEIIDSGSQPVGLVPISEQANLAEPIDLAQQQLSGIDTTDTPNQQEQGQLVANSVWERCAGASHPSYEFQSEESSQVQEKNSSTEQATQHPKPLTNREHAELLRNAIQQVQIWNQIQLHWLQSAMCRSQQQFQYQQMPAMQSASNPAVSPTGYVPARNVVRTASASRRRTRSTPVRLSQTSPVPMIRPLSTSFGKGALALPTPCEKGALALPSYEEKSQNL